MAWLGVGKLGLMENCLDIEEWRGLNFVWLEADVEVEVDVEMDV